MEIREQLDTSFIVVLTGAGISKESGIPVFRGKDGLWNKYKVEELATFEAFLRDPKLVWEWYRFRMDIIYNAKPNIAHIILAELEKVYPDFYIITQNIDGLHQEAGSKKVIELHGNIRWARCIECSNKILLEEVPKSVPPRCKVCGALLRPDVVWFGEPLPSQLLLKSIELSSKATLFIVIGTSGVVYPASELPYYAKEHGATLLEINPELTPISQIADITIREKATTGLKKLLQLLKLTNLVELL